MKSSGSNPFGLLTFSVEQEDGKVVYEGTRLPLYIEGDLNYYDLTGIPPLRSRDKLVITEGLSDEKS